MTDQPRLFSRPLELVGARHAAVVAEQLEVYRAFQPVSEDTYFNYRERTFRSGGVTLRTSPLGSFGADGGWLWSWADESTCQPGSPERELGLRLRQVGELIGAPEFVTARLDLAAYANPRMMAERLAVIAMGALDVPGYAVTVLPSGARQFSMIEDESVPRAPFSPDLVSARLASATEIFPAAPHETAIEYLRHHGFVVTVPNPTTVVGAREPGWVITLEFGAATGALERSAVTPPNQQGPRAQAAPPAEAANKVAEPAEPSEKPVAEPTDAQSAYLHELTDLINEIGSRLERGLPAQWNEFRFEFSGTVSAVAMVLRVTTPTGKIDSLPIPDGVVSLVMDLRTKMYSEIAGTWFGLAITSRSPGRYSVDFNNDSEPDTPAIKPEDYARDLQRFPRPQDRMPEWLLRKLAHARRYSEPEHVRQS